MGQLLLLSILDGVSYGALVFIVTVGLTLVFGVVRILNVAHGAFYAIGAYTAASLVLWLSSTEISPYFVYPALLFAALAVGAVLGPLVERLLLRRIYGLEQALQLLVTFALFMILEDAQKLVWGVRPYYADTPLQLLGTLEVGGVFYTSYQLLVLPGAALALLLGMRWFLRFSVLGKIITAVTEDREVSIAVGIDANRVFLLTFTLGTVLAALGGALASPTTSLVPGIGAEMIVLSFAVAATAGLGQVEGAALTALLIGLGRSLAVYLWPQMDAVVPYLIMVAVLLFRPKGLFGTVEPRRV